MWSIRNSDAPATAAVEPSRPPPPTCSAATVDAVLDAVKALRAGDISAFAPLIVLCSSGGATAAAAVVDSGGAVDVIRTLRAHACPEGSMFALLQAATLLRVLLQHHAPSIPPARSRADRSAWPYPPLHDAWWGSGSFDDTPVCNTLARGLRAATAAPAPAGADAAGALLRLLFIERRELLRELRPMDDSDDDVLIVPPGKSPGLRGWSEFVFQEVWNTEEEPVGQLYVAVLAAVAAHGAHATVAEPAWGLLGIMPFLRGAKMSGKPWSVHAAEMKRLNGEGIWPAQLALRALRSVASGALPVEVATRACIAMGGLAQVKRVYKAERWRAVRAELVAAAADAVSAAEPRGGRNVVKKGALVRVRGALDFMKSRLEPYA